MKIQHKTQSKHWHNFQVSILMHISYQHNPLTGPINLDSTIIKEIQYNVFDDPSHDSLFVVCTTCFHASFTNSTKCQLHSKATHCVDRWLLRSIQEHACMVFCIMVPLSHHIQ
jgi:hypothetical protein